MAKKQDPQIEWGFHAVIPRLVRTGYEKLTPVQKWLYVCLKDLCGEHGTCYRALRVLAEETGISIGMLSESIRCLHDAGLIHAEKKRRSLNPTAKEVWHITIVDIWQANAKTHPTKRSQNEHYKEENVHTVNNNVHIANDNSQERSPAEQQCSHSETEEVSISSINYEAVSQSSNVVATSSEDRNAPAFAIQIEGYPQFYYHDFCNHAQDRGCNDGLTLIVKPLDVVPSDILCQICYKPVHGPHGYYEIGKEDAPVPINFVERKSDKYKAITKEEIASHSQQAIRNDDEEDISLAETAKHKAMPKQTPGAGSPPAATPPGGSTAASVQASLTGPPADAVQRTASSPGTPSGAVQASIPKRPRGKVTQAPLKTPEEIAIDERCRALQQRINEWRGYPLEAKGQIINEYKSIRKLVEKYTDQQIEDIYVYLFTRHWKWSKPDNRYHIGAYVVLSEAQSVLQELKAPTPAQNGKAPTFVIDEERNRRNIEAMKARNAARRLAANG